MLCTQNSVQKKYPLHCKNPPPLSTFLAAGTYWTLKVSDRERTNWTTTLCTCLIKFVRKKQHCAIESVVEAHSFVLFMHHTKPHAPGLDLWLISHVVLVNVHEAITTSLHPEVVRHQVHSLPYIMANKCIQLLFYIDLLLFSQYMKCLEYQFEEYDLPQIIFNFKINL